MMTSVLVRRWFQVKRQQLLAASDLPVCEHPGLAGSHREEFQRLYLAEVLPERFKVGRGMVYGIAHRSRESDIVIWDGANYPSLPMLDHQFFFAESVRAVIESKSRWSGDAFADVLTKSEAIRSIIPTPVPGLYDDLLHLEMALQALQTGTESQGFMKVGHHIASVAVFLRGGSTFTLATLDPAVLEDADDRFPDLMLFLETGGVVIKQYEDTPRLVRYDMGADCLAMFTGLLLNVVTERATALEPVLDLYMYLPTEIAWGDPNEERQFKLTRFPAGRTPLWGPRRGAETREPEDP